MVVISDRISSARKRLQMIIWRLYFAFAFVVERQTHSPRFSFAFAFVMIILGMHTPQQQATLRKKKLKSQRFSCAFAFVIQQRGNPKSRIFFFASNCFCEDGSLLFSFAGVGATRLGATGPATLRGKWHSERGSERTFEKPLKPL